jgi:hypothetical protein
MPPTPDRPRKPAVPARGGQHSPPPKHVPAKPVAKPLTQRANSPAKPAPLPLPLPEQTPLPANTPRTTSTQRAWALHIKVPVWWGIVLGVGVALILCFEIGYTLGERRAGQRRPSEHIDLAAAKAADAPLRQPSEATPKVAPSTATPKEPIKSERIEIPKRATSSTPSVPPPAKEETPKPVEVTKPVEPGVALRFDKDILPIFQSKCFKCHGSVSKRGGLDLRSIASIVRGGNSGPGMKPGHPDDSPLWQSVKTGEMPPAKNPQLTSDEKQLILAWIAGGGK